MLYEGVWQYGEVTLVRADGWPKVMFEELNYDYYDPSLLESDVW